MKQTQYTPDEIKSLAKQLNINDIVAEANKGIRKKAGLFNYQTVYSILNRVSTKGINPVIANAVISLAKEKHQQINTILK